MLRRVIRTVALLLILGAPRIASADWIYLLNGLNTLGVVDLGAPGQLVATIPVTGLPAREYLTDIGFRPKDGQLYAIAPFQQNGVQSSVAHLYRVHMLTGAATRIGTIDLPLDADEPSLAFNPITDELRIMSSNGLNYRVNPDTGAIVGGQPDTPIPGGNYAVTSLAHAYDTPGTLGTTLYAISSACRRPTAAR